MSDLESLKASLTAYIVQFKEIVDRYPEYKAHFSKYYEDGIKIRYIISSNEVTLFYLFNTEEIDVRNISEEPEIGEGIKSYIETLPINRFNRLVENPTEFAYYEVEEQISFIKYEEDMAEHYEQLEREYGEYYEKFGTERLNKYFTESKIVYDETFKNHKKEIHYIHRLLFTQSILETSFIISSYTTLGEIYHQVSKDIESSFFLALHGKYVAAHSLLRRWLEIVFCATYLDFKINNETGEKTIEEWQNKRDRWLRGSRALPNFSGEYGIISELINPDKEDLLNEISPKQRANKTAYPWKKYVRDHYSTLSKFVHFGGKTDERWLFSFSEYNEENFRQWFSYLNKVNEMCSLILYFTLGTIGALFKKESSDYEPIEYVPLLTYEQEKKLPEVME